MNSEYMVYINQIMEKAKNNSNFNYSTKLKIGNKNAKESSGFEMQKPKNARSATTVN